MNAGSDASEHRAVERFGAEIALMVVGTPRSGTTLVQRLVAERCGLPTVPETHMFTVFAPRLLRKTRFPLAGPELLDALSGYVGMKQHRGGAPSAQVLFDRLGGRAASLADVFVAVVAELADGADRVVEKTPDHLLWVEHLAPIFTATKFIAVVRDPRAVFASTAQVHWGQRNAVAAAERWSRDQRLLLSLTGRLGADRLLLIRYEDLVADEEGTVGDIRRFVDLGADSRGGGGNGGDDRSAGQPSDVFRAHEMDWKGRVSDPVTAERIEAWKAALPTESVGRIEAICRPMMDSFGYEPTMASSLRLGPTDQFDRLRYRLRRIGHEQRIRHSYAPRAGLR